MNEEKPEKKEGSFPEASEETGPLDLPETDLKKPRPAMMFQPTESDAKRESGGIWRAIQIMLIILASVVVSWKVHDYYDYHQARFYQVESGGQSIVAEARPAPLELTEQQISVMLQEVTPEQKRVSEEKYKLEEELNKRDLTWKVLRGAGYLKDSKECQRVFKEAQELKKNFIQVSEQLAKLDGAANGLLGARQDIRLQGYVSSNPKTQKLVENVQKALDLKKAMESGAAVIPDRNWQGEDPDAFMKNLKSSESASIVPLVPKLNLPAADLTAGKNLVVEPVKR